MMLQTGLRVVLNITGKQFNKNNLFLKEMNRT